MIVQANEHATVFWARDMKECFKKPVQQRDEAIQRVEQNQGQIVNPIMAKGDGQHVSG